MKLLLDAHSLIWFLTDDPKLSARAASVLDDASHPRWTSAASLWEIAIKVGLNKLHLGDSFDRLFPEFLERNNIGVLGVELPHLSRLLALPNIYKDPFDRLVVAQAIVENLTLVTCDREITKYPVATLW
ncbi:MAG: type II toxin-antitoxin system VapC family toxin [Verrucomicrobia bacterium]|nr:type II toxin-antitoxin system VapC family toxin [Verrucomicrobiota bacterium]